MGRVGGEVEPRLGGRWWWPGCQGADVWHPEEQEEERAEDPLELERESALHDESWWQWWVLMTVMSYMMSLDDSDELHDES